MNCWSGPPPQVQKIVGGLPAPMASWIFCLYDWFSTKSTVMWSPLWLFSKDVTRLCTAVLAGLGPVVTSHIVTAPAEVLVVDPLPPPAADPHAASARTATAAVAPVSHRRCEPRLAGCPGVSAMVPPGRHRPRSLKLT